MGERKKAVQAERDDLKRQAEEAGNELRGLANDLATIREGLPKFFFGETKDNLDKCAIRAHAIAGALLAESRGPLDPETTGFLLKAGKAAVVAVAPLLPIISTGALEGAGALVVYEAWQRVEAVVFEQDAPDQAPITPAPIPSAGKVPGPASVGDPAAPPMDPAREAKALDLLRDLVRVDGVVEFDRFPEDHIAIWVRDGFDEESRPFKTFTTDLLGLGYSVTITAEGPTLASQSDDGRVEVVVRYANGSARIERWSTESIAHDVLLATGENNNKLKRFGTDDAGRPIYVEVEPFD